MNRPNAMLSSNRDRLSAKDCLPRWGILGGCALPVAGAYAHAQGISIPLLACPLKWMTGVPCPTCGMTRSFLALAQGHLEQSLTYHLFGPLLFIGFVVAFIHVFVELVTQKRLSAFYLRWLSNCYWQAAILIPLFLYYGLRLAVRFALLDGATGWWSSALGQILVAAAQIL